MTHLIRWLEGGSWRWRFLTALLFFTPPVGWFGLWLLGPIVWRLNFGTYGKTDLESYTTNIHGDGRLYISMPATWHPLHRYSQRFPEPTRYTELPSGTVYRDAIEETF